MEIQEQGKKNIAGNVIGRRQQDRWLAVAGRRSGINNTQVVRRTRPSLGMGRGQARMGKIWMLLNCAAIAAWRGFWGEMFSRAGAAKDGYMSCAAKKRTTRDESERAGTWKKKYQKKKGLSKLAAHPSSSVGFAAAA